jgi:hypothetical protein
MDERLEKALAFGKYRATIENRRKSLQRRFESMLTVHYGSGMFFANQETIGFVAALLNDGMKDAILIDTKKNPVDVEDLATLYQELTNAYFKATNEFSSEMKKLAKARDVKKAMDW